MAFYSEDVFCVLSSFCFRKQSFLLIWVDSSLVLMKKHLFDLPLAL